jgi:hypothetical protein
MRVLVTDDEERLGAGLRRGPGGVGFAAMSR